MKKIIGAAIVGLAVAAAPVAAQGPGPEPRQGREGRRGHRAQAIVAYLGLTAEQQEQWRALHERHREATAPLREQGRELHQRVREAVEADEPDAAVGAAVKAAHAHLQAMKADREAFEAQLQSILTEDQKVKLEAFEAARNIGRKGRRPGWGGRGGPGRGPADGAGTAWGGPPVEG